MFWFALAKCLTKDGIKDSCVLKVLENSQKNVHDRVYYSGSDGMWSCHFFERSAPPNTISYEFPITLDWKMWLQWWIISFPDANFDIDITLLWVHLKVLQAIIKNVRQQLKKLVVFKF